MILEESLADQGTVDVPIVCIFSYDVHIYQDYFVEAARLSIASCAYVGRTQDHEIRNIWIMPR